MNKIKVVEQIDIPDFVILKYGSLESISIRTHGLSTAQLHVLINKTIANRRKVEI